MRCKSCNVDLEENVKICPLCGGSAADDKPQLKGFTPAPFPTYTETGGHKQEDFTARDFPHKAIFLLFLLLSVLCAVFGKVLYSELLNCVLPLLIALPSVIFFIHGLKEKSRLMKSALSLLVQCAVALIFTLVFTAINTAVSQTLIAFAACALLTLFALFLRPKQFTEQIKAYFVL